MTSLLDIGPISDKVNVNGTEVDVFGVTPEGFFYLLHKFPQLEIFFGSASNEFSMAAMSEVAPSSIAHALAVATTSRPDFKTVNEWREAVEKAAAVALNLSAHHQMMIFQAGLRLTFPDGIGPFMRAVEDLAKSIDRVSGKTASATRSSSRSRSGFITDSPGLRLGKGAPRANLRH